MATTSSIELTINGDKYQVDANVGVDTSLNTFLRDHANLRGTKFMCLEGGCGACTVSVTSNHPVTGQPSHYAVNSCLVSVLSCDGWDVTTVEGLGDKQKGYHLIQTRLANLNGTQCGYCTPGMVMNMNSLLENNQNITMKEVENSFGGNICRCTGYRPILDAFKSLASDASSELLQKCQDIEEFDKLKTCPKTGIACSGKCSTSISRNLHLTTPEALWHKVGTVQAVLDILKEVGDVPYMLVDGNTAQGVYRITVPPRIFIDISGVAELKQYSISSDIVLGANVSLTDAMRYLTEAAKLPQFSYAKDLVEHIDLIANVPVRNIGSLAGNLSIKHQYREFPSDIFLILETVGALLSIVDANGNRTSVSPAAYLDLNMKKKLIVRITLPGLVGAYAHKSYKIMPRAQNAHAYVNSGFLLKFTDDRTSIVSASIVYGGISPKFIHATATELALIGKNLYDLSTLKSALSILRSELDPNLILPDATPEYRKNLALSLFYKFVLNTSPSHLVSPLNRSGGEILTREVSRGLQSYDSNKNVWPLNQPVRKLEAISQCSGEAKYANDITSIPGEMFAALVLARRALANITDIDASSALKIDGVVAFYSAKDIPGKNTIFNTKNSAFPELEELFVSKKVLYNGQPVGIVVAKTRQLAYKAAKLVQINYEVTDLKPVINIRDALAKGRTDYITKVFDVKSSETGSDIQHIIKGSFDIGGQYHYTMETQTCVCVPNEEGLDVYSSTQWMDLVHSSIQELLNIPMSRINIHVRRLGGGYGAKISRSNIVSQACALAAFKLNKPVRLVMTLEDNMEAVGKRASCCNDYEVGVNADGQIQYMKNSFYQDYGCYLNEEVIFGTKSCFPNCYDLKTWDYDGSSVRTDVASNTWCRAPGSTEAIAMIENIMEHIAQVTGKDPIEVRLANMATDSALPGLIPDFKASTDYYDRKAKVDAFNVANRWRKRGISIVPMKYPFSFFGNFAALVSIYSSDGTVAVTHGGIEMGQGLNTKVAQVCAHILGIPLSYISIKESNSLTAPNAMVSGGSVASESCCYAAMIACQTLLKRLEPVKAKMDNPSWEELVEQAYTENVDLCATYMFSTNDDVKPYKIWGLASSEVEVDLLTGNIQIVRVDILEDTGESLSQDIDVGQVEGGFVMGLGYWLSEELTFDPNSGQLLTNRTWNYKPPGAKDIPVDFRIQFLRNSSNPLGVLRSKATGEPSVCMSIVVLFALRHALRSARLDATKKDEWFSLGSATTSEVVFLNALNDIDQFTF